MIRKWMLLLGLFLTACDSGLPLPPSMRKPEPVVVQSPESINAIPDSALRIYLGKDKISASYRKRFYSLAGWNELDSMLRFASRNGLKPDIVLLSDSAQINDVDSAIKVLGRNGIFRFNLVTNQNRKPR